MSFLSFSYSTYRYRILPIVYSFILELYPGFPRGKMMENRLEAVESRIGMVSEEIYKIPTIERNIAALCKGGSLHLKRQEVNPLTEPIVQKQVKREID